MACSVVSIFDNIITRRYGDGVAGDYLRNLEPWKIGTPR